jgi:hypothetical protein
LPSEIKFKRHHASDVGLTVHCLYQPMIKISRNQVDKIGFQWNPREKVFPLADRTTRLKEGDPWHQEYSARVMATSQF